MGAIATIVHIAPLHRATVQGRNATLEKRPRWGILPWGPVLHFWTFWFTCFFVVCLGKSLCVTTTTQLAAMQLSNWSLTPRNHSHKCEDLSCRVKHSLLPNRRNAAHSNDISQCKACVCIFNSHINCMLSSHARKAKQYNVLADKSQ